MRAAKGSSVTLSVTCRLQDGTPFEFPEHGRLTVVAGAGKTLPTVEEGVLGMEPGERRVISVPAGEVNDYLRSRSSQGAPRRERSEFGYDFGPGESGDVLLTIPPPPARPSREVPAGVGAVLFEVTVVPEEAGGEK